MTATGILSVPDVPDAHTSTLPSDPVARISAVAFDVGETLIDESRIWLRWADRLGVPPLTMLGVVGAMAALDRMLVEAFHVLRPGLDLGAEIRRWRADDPDGLRENFDADDLYGDVRACFAAMGEAGVRVIVAGNQPPQALGALEQMDLGADAILISAVLGVEKPAQDFFDAVTAAAGCPPREIAYVGDRLDNDVLPAREAGMRTVLLRRGPWGYLHAERPDAARADVVADSLLDLPRQFAQLR
jgi:HAD superfamily hydrolase (TIGR01549 family)